MNDLQIVYFSTATVAKDIYSHLRPLVERARSCCEAADYENAEAIYKEVLGALPRPRTPTERVMRGEACAFFARQAAAKKKPGTAADFYREALTFDPLGGEYRAEFIKWCLMPVHGAADALAEARRLVRINPDMPEGWRLLGILEHDAGNAEAAIAAFDQQLALEQSPRAWLDRCTAALDTEDYDTVRHYAGLAMDSERRGDALHCLALVAARENRNEDAIALYDEAVEAGCNDVGYATWNKSICLHSMGRYREGWRANESRLRAGAKQVISLPGRRFAAPIWEGQPPPGRILVHAESGAGDNLCLARYLPMLAARGYEVIYEAREEMVSLMARSFPGVKVAPKALDWPGALGLPPFDYHLPMLSLPDRFETDIDTVPWNGPYLVPDPEKVEHYRKLVPAGAVGICWSAGIRGGVWIERYGRRKSMPLHEMSADLLSVDRERLVSLQVGPERAERGNRWTVMDVLPPNPSWDDTAALIACLDAVVTVDTGVSHLAGALGKPVYLAMHRQGSWHYMIEVPGASWNDRSPWYPETRIYRQARQNEWSDVMGRIAADLSG